MTKLRSTAEFHEFLANNPVSVIKFYTDWCPDCSRIDKQYGEWSANNTELAAFAEINADELHEVAETFEVRGIPSFLVFKGNDLETRLYSRDAKSPKQVIDFCQHSLKELATR